MTKQEMEKIKQNMKGYIFYTPFEVMKRINEIMTNDKQLNKEVKGE